MSETTEDAKRTVAECVVTLQQLAQRKETALNINSRGASLVRALQNALLLMRQQGPLLPHVQVEWNYAFEMCFREGDRATLMFIVEALTLGLNLYQNPDIGISLITPNEDSNDDDDTAQDQG